MSWVAPLSITLLLLLGLRLSRKPLKGAGWQLVRVLLPSWRFFEDIELGPRLWVRVRRAGASYGEWQLALSAPRRGPGSLLLDAATSSALAQQSVVEQLWSELDGQELGSLPALVSYRLVQAIAERTARAPDQAPGVAYQFCLSEGSAGEAEGFVSMEHGL